MGSIFRKQSTKRIPKGAEIQTLDGQRLARWRGRDGKMKSAPVVMGKDGVERIRTTAATWTAKLRDGAGHVVEASTGCRSRDAALQRLAEMEREAEKVKAGVISEAEAAAQKQNRKALSEHVADYCKGLTQKGNTSKHADDMAQKLTRLSNECGWRLPDFDESRIP